MPAQIKVIRANDFIRAKPTGELDLEACERLLAGIAKAAASLDDFEILVDTREAQGTMSATDLWFLAENQGFNIGAFTVYEEAMEWLIMDSA